jgi:hypothetical protein
MLFVGAVRELPELHEFARIAILAQAGIQIFQFLGFLSCILSRKSYN